MLPDLPVSALRLLRGKAPGVGQHEEHAPRLGQAPGQGLPPPVRVDLDVVDGLHAGGVVVQHHDLPSEALTSLRQLPGHPLPIRQRDAVRQSGGHNRDVPHHFCKISSGRMLVTWP